MRSARAVVTATLLSAAQLHSTAAVEPVAAEPLRISALEDIRADLALLDCDDPSRYYQVSRLFARAGAPAQDVSDFEHKHVRNLLVRKAGASPETIVLGAHYDKTEHGCGAIDNWTGIVALAHLYSTMRSVVPAKSLLFVAFDEEELGLLGSQAMVRQISNRERARYCAMINLDSLGMAMPQVLDNSSSRKLRKLTEEIARSMEMPFDHGRVDFADADSSAYLRRGIPAVTIHGLSDDGLAMLHTDDDQPSRVNPTSVYLGYRLALALLTRVDGMACDAMR